LNFESETAKDSGYFYRLDKRLPIFQPDSGINRGVHVAVPESPISLKMPAQFSEQNTDVVYGHNGVFGTNVVMTETTTSSRIFRDSQSLYEVDLTSTGESNPSVLLSVVARVNHNGDEWNIPLQWEGLNAQTEAVTFKEQPVSTEVNVVPLVPDDNHDGVIYLRMSSFAAVYGDELPSVKIRSGENEQTLNWETVEGGGKELEPFVLIPPGTALSTTFKTLELAVGQPKVSVFVANPQGGDTKVTEEPTVRAPLLACSIAGGIDVDKHLLELDNLIGRKRRVGAWSSRQDAYPPLGWPASTTDNLLTLDELKAEVPKREFLYLLAHGYVEDPNALQNYGFVGAALYNPQTKKTDQLLVPEDIETANAENEDPYYLVFMNGCASTDMTNLIPRKFQTAFGAKNYVGWDHPTLLVDAAAGAVKFFNQLDGGKTVSDAVNGIDGHQADPLTNTKTLSGTHGLTSFTSDDEYIIDQTP
jgi:hypothetical protein